MIQKDVLVNAIFDAVSKMDASPDDRRLAIIRASQIAQAYNGECESLIASVFGG